MPLASESEAPIGAFQTPPIAHDLPSAPASSTNRRAASLLVLVLLMRPFGNLILAWGMRHTQTVLSINPLPYFQAMLNPFVAGGVILLAGSLLVRMALLSVADLSYVLPLTASGYVISSLLGWLFLKEAVTPSQWAGTILIFLGTAFVGMTKADTTHPAVPSET